MLEDVGIFLGGLAALIGSIAKLVEVLKPTKRKKNKR
ncbi:hypothetical protein J2S45_000256 [Trueperella abortisuis]|uniref:Uncharacterized protein n=1 Tax=Trueperella abortisuis TaxID=445930 RepID=A0ABT9PFU1_9ACTO|nr:hypothetical protein [Trueperella abortisuis]